MNEQKSESENGIEKPPTIEQAEVVANEIPEIFCCAGQLNNVSFFTDHEMEYRVGGAGLCEEEALVATFGEAVERYNAGIYDKKEMLFCSFDELSRRGYKAINPSSFSLPFKSAQYLFGIELSVRAKTTSTIE